MTFITMSDRVATSISSTATADLATPALDPLAIHTTATDTVTLDTAALDTALLQLTERVRGAIIGSALGDALAAPAQYRRAGTFMPIRDLLGGGPYDLPPGAFSDDAAVAFILIDTLLENQRFDSKAWIDRLSLWAQDGIGSATGVCAGISAPVARLLRGTRELDQALTDRSAREFLVRAWLLGVYWAFETERLGEACEALVGLVHAKPEVSALALHIATQAARVTRGEGLLPLSATTPASFPPTQAVLDTPQRLWETVLQLASAEVALRDKLLWLVNQGQDADINVTLLATVLGTLHGAAALPSEWTQALVPLAMIESLSARLARSVLERWWEHP
jgi:ADP-ribosyl-[dinitrogen reductase] hydrolase